MDDMKRTSEYRRMLPFIAKASNDVGDDTQGEDIQALIQALSTHKSSDDHDGRYYTESEITSFLSGKADKAISLTAGNGLTGGGDLSSNRTFAVGAGTGITVNADDVAINLAANLTWTGSHTFSGSLITGSIMPALADVYDLGDYTKPWRKIWGSELSAVVFSQYEQVLLGGWLTISKGEGKLAAAVAPTDTEIDLGTGTFATNDIIVFRSISSNGTPQVEYMKVGTLVSGTTYNVTRDLDGTGANNWPDGTVYGNWGQAGNGRVELNAYDTPRLSVHSHGAAIADFREQLRFGDLNGGWGYSSSVFGGAFGAYETGKANITIDPTNGIRIRNYNVDVIKLTGTEASFENFITLGANGGIRQGTGTWGSSFTGTAMWNESGVMNIGGWNTGVKQWWGGSDGKFYAGNGSVVIDAGGLTMLSATSSGNNVINYKTIDGYDIGEIRGWGNSTNQFLSITALQNLDLHSQLNGSFIGTVLTIRAYNSVLYPYNYPRINLMVDNEVAGINSLVIDKSNITYTASGGHTFVGPNDGWNRITDTWTYASATTITVPSGAASIYKVGQGFRLTANGVVKQGYIVDVADTLLTTAGDALTNHTFSAISYTNTPHTAIGFPVWFAWSPTVTFNGTAPTTLTSASSFRYFIVGKSCYLSIYAYYTNAGANNTTITVNSLPVAPVSSAVTENQYVATSVTNGVTPNLTAGFVRATGDIYIVCTSVSTNRVKASGAYEIA